MGNNHPQPLPRSVVASGVYQVEAERINVPVESLAYSLVRDGYAIIPGAVSQTEVHAALRVINRSLGKHPPIRDRMCPDCTSSPEILDLYNRSQVRSIIERLVGRHHPVGGAQIALRFPGDNCTDNFSVPPAWSSYWHIDGLAAESNPHTPYGDIHNFTALVGVLLQDCTEEFMGNLTVYPGSHLALQNHFRSVGFTSLLSQGAAGLPSASIPGTANPHKHPIVAFPHPPYQVCGRAGDVIIVNYCTAHTIAPNISPFTRYAIYFRVTSSAYTSRDVSMKHRPESMLDVWRDWVGVRGILDKLNEEHMTQSSADTSNVSAEDNNDEDNALKMVLERSKWDK